MTQIIEKIKQRQFVEKPWEHQPKFHFVVNFKLANDGCWHDFYRLNRQSWTWTCLGISIQANKLWEQVV